MTDVWPKGVSVMPSQPLCLGWMQWNPTICIGIFKPVWYLTRLFRLNVESGECVPIPLTTPGHPMCWPAAPLRCSLCLAYGQNSLRSNTGRPLSRQSSATRQHKRGFCLQPQRLSLTPLCEAEHRRSVWIKHDECLSAASFRHVPNWLRSAGNPQGEHGLPFCLVRLFWASKINERPAAAMEWAACFRLLGFVPQPNLRAIKFYLQIVSLIYLSKLQ